jgi:hypothetical protein
LSFVRTARLVALIALLLPALSLAQQPPAYDPVAYDAPAPTTSQPWSDTIPGHLAIVDGAAWLERDGDVERAEENIALLAGDRIRTADGRVEVLFADGSVLDIDRGTTVALLSESLLGLERGQVRLTLARATTAVDYRVDGAGSTAWIRGAGEYRVAIAAAGTPGAELRLTVIRGLAELASPHGRTAVRTGYEAVTTAETMPSLPYMVSVAMNDAFDRWAYDRRSERIGVTSAQYLPEPIYAYGGVLDRYGSWNYERPYGYVWYPRVDTSWRPYHDGRWSFSASFGWIWVGGSRWSWPTHHYGRWGHTNNRWFWIPNRHWGPAWVSWVSAPGYIGWCPLGFDNRPLISITNITVIDSRIRRSWTFIPSHHFVRNVYVRNHVVVPALIAPQQRFTVLREPAAPATGRFATARRPLGAPTAMQTVTPRSAGTVTGRSPSVTSVPASRAAMPRSAAEASVSRPAVESSRAPARAPAVRATRPAASAPVDRTDAVRSAAPRRAPAAGALAPPVERAEVGPPVERVGPGDRSIGVAPGRATRAVGRANPDRPVADEVQRVTPSESAVAPRRAAPARRAVPEPSEERMIERASPAYESRSEAPPSVWSAPESRGMQRRAPSASSAPPSDAPAERSSAPPAPVWRARSRSAESAPADSPPPAPAERAARPSAPSGESEARTRAPQRSAPDSAPSESSGGGRRAGSRR